MTIDLESWQAIAGAIAIVSTAVYNRWESRKTRKTAEKAVELSAPTGNGFARKVTEALGRIETKVDRTEEKLDHHLQVHADSDVANRANHVRTRRVLRDVNEL